MRILGIDIGSKSIKAVEIDSAFGRYEIRDYHEVFFENDETPSQTLNRLVQSLPRRLDRVVMGLKAGAVTFRNLNLPAKNKKALQAAIGFELEDELPFPIEQSCYDHSVISQSRQASMVHVEATLQKNVAAILHSIQDTEVDPDVLTTESWAMRILLNRVTPLAPDQPPVLVVNMGHERTTFYCHHQGQPVLSRELPWGGRDLTTAICKKWGVPMDQAERTKLDNGFIIPAGHTRSATLEQIDFSDTLMRAAEPLLRELRSTLFSCKNSTRESVRTIYACGGTSLLPGLLPFLQEQLDTEVKPLLALTSVSSSGVTYSEQTDATFAQALCLSLCMVGADRSACINFRKGEFAKTTRSRDFDTQTIRRVLMASGAVGLSLFISLMVQSLTYKSKLADVNTQLEKSIKTFFGSVAASAVKTYLASPTTLKTTLNKELGKQRDLYKLLGPNPHSPVDFLKELSTAVPKDVVVDMIQFQAGASPSAPFSPSSETTASLSFLVATPQVAEKLAAVFTNKHPGLQKGNIEEVAGADPGQKRWKVVFSGKLQDTAYGK